MATRSPGGMASSRKYDLHTKASLVKADPRLAAESVDGDPMYGKIGPSSVIDDELNRMQEHVMALCKSLEEVFHLATNRLRRSYRQSSPVSLVATCWRMVHGGSAL